MMRFFLKRSISINLALSISLAGNSIKVVKDATAIINELPCKSIKVAKDATAIISLGEGGVRAQVWIFFIGVFSFSQESPLRTHCIDCLACFQQLVAG
jgi:hypothetical protein